ncbi:MAG TPA: glycosyltransferase family 2 protein [Candidatus Bathyarchaeia archaeon]|jgi:GT2 family glycosyltransferase|nr:glycosyltransferase family 2 protein [Candidatus Bathyarchaeia archaeon]
MRQSFSIIVATKNRAPMIQALLDSMKEVAGLDKIRPQIIVGDNNSQDETWELLQRTAKTFPLPIKLLKVKRPGKSAVLNDAVRAADGRILVFLDDDVIPDRRWLEASERFFSQKTYHVGQGKIQLQSPDAHDPQVQKLLQRFRTIPHVEYNKTTDRIHSLNGANFAVLRDALERVGPFDERLGPGASGTSEDVELARRFTQAGIGIGYMQEAIAYHRVDRSRLTEEYFKSLHKRQGKSRLLIKDRSVPHILFGISSMTALYGINCVFSKERRRYRSKGRIYHYLGMLEAKWNGQADK